MDEARLAGAFAIGFATVLLLTPVAIGIARRTAFYDHPVGYKRHPRPTPYLGGAAVIVGFILTCFALVDATTTYLPIIIGTLSLLVVGTIDDRVGLGPLIRVVVTCAAAILLWHSDLGWHVFDDEIANLALTLVWVTGLVNAFNLMDNLDGAAPSVAAACACGTGALAYLDGEVALATLSLALAGACAGFLPRNLKKPAEIFLGDGGSMPVGFILAAVVSSVPQDQPFAWEQVAVAAPLVGLPILDTALVVVSRIRRRARLLTGSYDHLSHRLLSRLRSPRAVALVLGSGQAALCLVEIGLLQVGPVPALAGAFTCLIVGVAVIAALEPPSWDPALQDSSAWP